MPRFSAGGERGELINLGGDIMVRLRRLNQYPELDIPDEHVCSECKNFTACLKVRAATAKDQVCAYVPNNFAMPGEESKADVSNRRDMEMMGCKQ